MSHPVAKKLESALRQYLEANFQGEGEPLADLQIYEGHRSGKIMDVDRLTITAVNPGGPLAQAGIYSVDVQLLLETYAIEQDGEIEKPDGRHQRRAEEMSAIFERAKMGEVVDAINATSAETGVGASCFEVAPTQEGRGDDKHGTAWPMTWTAHLTETA